MTDVVMPQMGESIVEGTLTKWLKKPGEHVDRDEPLFEISTDKVDTEIPSPAAGTLSEVLVEEGKTVGINTVVARIEEGGNGAGPKPKAAEPARAAAPPPPAAAPSRPAAPPPVAAAPPPPPPVEDAPAVEPAGPLSPLVRKMARENNIDLSQVTGTGAGGRITKQDVDAYLAAASSAPAPAQRPAPQAPPAPSPVRPPAPAPNAVATVQPQIEVPPPPREPAPIPGSAPALRVEPMSIMRQKIAEHMT